MDNEAANNALNTQTEGTDQAGEGTEQGQGQQQETTFTQADLDRRVNQALEKNKASNQKAIEDAVAEALKKGKTEGEKLAKMSAQEKAEAAQKEREDALAKREAELNQRELKATVTTALAEKGLPASLVEPLAILGNADAINKSIDTITEAINAKVAEGIKAGLRQDPPKDGASDLAGSEDDPFKLIENRYK